MSKLGKLFKFPAAVKGNAKQSKNIGTNAACQESFAENAPTSGSNRGEDPNSARGSAKGVGTTGSNAPSSKRSDNQPQSGNF